MKLEPIAINLELRPQRRFDVIDVSQKVVEEVGDIVDIGEDLPIASQGGRPGTIVSLDAPERISRRRRPNRRF